MSSPSESSEMYRSIECAEMIPLPNRPSYHTSIYSTQPYERAFTQSGFDCRSHTAVISLSMIESEDQIRGSEDQRIRECIPAPHSIDFSRSRVRRSNYDQGTVAMIIRIMHGEILICKHVFLEVQICSAQA